MPTMSMRLYGSPTMKQQQSGGWPIWGEGEGLRSSLDTRWSRFQRATKYRHDQAEEPTRTSWRRCPEWWGLASPHCRFRPEFEDLGLAEVNHFPCAPSMVVVRRGGSDFQRVFAYLLFCIRRR